MSMRKIMTLTTFPPTKSCTVILTPLGCQCVHGSRDTHWNVDYLTESEYNVYQLSPPPVTNCQQLLSKQWGLMKPSSINTETLVGFILIWLGYIHRLCNIHVITRKHFYIPVLYFSGSYNLSGPSSPPSSVMTSEPWRRM